MTDRSALRTHLRKTRRELSPVEQADHAEALATHISTHRLFFNSHRIACYFPVDGEIDPYPLLYRAIDMGKSVYLPVLVPFGSNRLWFAPYQLNCKMALNRYGIPEPQVPKSKLLDPRSLDLVLAPLVGFDKNCNRLGMGGGYYDRTFAFLRNRHSWIKPRLLGIAYDLQKTGQLPQEKWDVPLYGVATESGVSLRNQTL
ncbi:MAG: 5-formyltetrahydrofolate cyclo-ligase [Gammaproteobacteria bacterium]|nr:5-formyltetrahydrofolate cyclo-ligase [Gammaproteobacteria bacterium]